MSDYSSPSQKSWLDAFGWQIPLAILFVTFLITNTLQLTELIRQHGQLAQAETQLTRDDVRKQLGEAQLVGRKLDALIRELVTLAPTNANAKHILDDFHIQAPPAAAAH